MQLRLFASPASPGAAVPFGPHPATTQADTARITHASPQVVVCMTESVTQKENAICHLVPPAHTQSTRCPHTRRSVSTVTM